MALSPDGDRLVASCEQKLCIWDTDDGSIIDRFGGGSLVAWSPDGSTIASNAPDAGLVLLDADTGETIAKSPGHSEPKGTDVPWGIEALDISSDAKTLASVAQDGDVRKWSTDDGEALDAIETKTELQSDLAFSPDGKHLAVANRGSPVEIREVDSGDLVTTLHDTDDLIAFQVVFSPDGRWLATRNSTKNASGKPVSLWDTSTFERKKSFDHEVDAGDIAFGPEGDRLAFSDTSGDRVVVWSHTNDETQTIRPDAGTPTEIAFSPSGRYLYVSSIDTNTTNSKAPEYSDSSLIKWDLETGKPVTEFDEP